MENAINNYGVHTYYGISKPMHAQQVTHMKVVIVKYMFQRIGSSGAIINDSCQRVFPDQAIIRATTGKTGAHSGGPTTIQIAAAPMHMPVSNAADDRVRIITKCVMERGVVSLESK
jgi:hypothetical protein